MEAERTLYNALRCLWKLMNLIHVLPQERGLSYFIIFLCSPNMLCRKKEWKYISGFRDSLVNMILLLLRDFINFDIANEDNIKKDNKIRDVQYSWKGIIVFQEMLFYRQEVNIPTYLFFILLVVILTHFATNKRQPNTLYMYLRVKVIDNWSRR